MIFSEKLIALRKQRGMSQEELAERLDVTRQSVSNPTLTFAQPIQPEGWITRKGGMRPVEG